MLLASHLCGEQGVEPGAANVRAKLALGRDESFLQ